jgi:hypothetical protein
MNRSGIILFITFFVYVMIQVLLFKNLVLFNTAFCFFYIAFILLLPIDTNDLTLMGIGFVLGFLVDIFYDSLGLHAGTTVLVAYLRNFWLRTITPQGGYDAGTGPGLGYGLQWFLVFATPLVFIQLAFLFFIEAGGFSVFWYTMLKVIGSLFFTMTVIMLALYIFPERSRL